MVQRCASTSGGALDLSVGLLLCRDDLVRGLSFGRGELRFQFLDLEAPRGLIYHRYEIADDASVVSARIVPPTSQNQLSIEEDLCAVATLALDLPDDALRDKCEQTIRNYDPCISCSCHFLRLAVHRT